MARYDSAMASPLQSAKTTVNLAAAGPRVSRIRRNPPPPPAKAPVLDREDRDKLSATLGVFAIALALAAVIAGIGIHAGWTPRDYELHYQMD
jgi:hypothetical protein